eukprot:TRINITY_DN3590_c0_g1_i2.p1 TRINITY_DN3590_c0_g1~~TRINITY_DN3590_c0_g1_i2.p1  ORF type:complete len:666 (+),score=88.25 TRINITY_DN3590_c0_g1_i2:1015-3012(+)
MAITQTTMTTTTTTTQASYFQSPSQSWDCASGYGAIATAPECKSAGEEFGLIWKQLGNGWPTPGGWDTNLPNGCHYNGFSRTQSQQDNNGGVICKLLAQATTTATMTITQARRLSSKATCSSYACGDGLVVRPGCANLECSGGVCTDEECCTGSRTLQESGCQCPLLCPQEQESCYFKVLEGVWACEDVLYPFREATACIPKCAYKRDSATGTCLVKCPDPQQTEVLENQLESHCPVRCPDLRQEAEEMGLDVQELFGEVYRPLWLSPPPDIPADQVVQMFCPLLCESGHVASYPDFVCPSPCFSSTAPLLDPDTAKPVFAWPGQSCPKVCSTGILRWGDVPCPIFCLGQNGEPITDELTGEPLEILPPSSSASAAEVRSANCPRLCGDGSVDLYGLGCAETDAPLTNCPGEPTECLTEKVIQASSVADCPIMCATLRNCALNQSGLIYPDDNVICPQPCFDSIHGNLLIDSSGDIVFDWGSGCPQRCPEIVDGSGNEFSPSSTSAGKDDNVTVIGIGSWWFPPVRACSLACLDSSGQILTWDTSKNGSVGLDDDPTGLNIVTILPLAEKYDAGTDTTIYKAVAGTDDELRGQMCPIRCPDTGYFLHPQWVRDADDFWMQSMLMSEKDCPLRCADGSLVWPSLTESCDAAAMSALSSGQIAGYDF